MNVLLAAALQYAAFGWQVCPLHTWTPAGCSCGRDCGRVAAKHPRTFNGLKDATTEERVIRTWWELQWPDANIAVVTGAASGIVILDLDVDKGGEESLEDMQRKHGRLPGTVESMTGGGGRHLVFRHPGVPIRNRQNWSAYPGLDVRGDGGYFIAAPSLHRSGRRYEWEASSVPGEVPVSEMPSWLVAVLAAGPEAPAGKYDREEEGRPAKTGPILTGCEWLRHCVNDAPTLGEGAWYAMLTIAGRCEDGQNLAHHWSKPHAGYSVEQCEAKLRHAMKDTGPFTCARIRADLDGEPYCSACLHWSRVKSPISLGRGMLSELEPPPGVGESPVSAPDWDAPVPEDPDPPQVPAQAIPVSAPAREEAPDSLDTEDGLPRSEEAERALCGGILTCGDTALIREALEIATPPDCYWRAHDLILQAARDCAEEMRPVDRVSVTERLREMESLHLVGGGAYLDKLIHACPRSERITSYAETVREKSQLRSLIGLCDEARRDACRAGAKPTEVQEILVRLLLAQQGSSRLGEAITYAEALDLELGRIERGETERALEFGIPKLDRLTGGLGRGEVGVICGRPGMGKSVWCAMQLHHAAETWGAVLYVSLEMGAGEVVRRDLAGLTKITYHVLRDARNLSSDERDRLAEARRKLRQYASRILIDTRASSLTTLISRVHRYRLRNDVQAVILDYGQLVRDDTASRNAGKAEEVMRIARALKTEIAVPQDVPVWVAAQANRGSEGKATPARSEQGQAQAPTQARMLGYGDLGWSSEWEAVAGRILFLNPDLGRSQFDTPQRRHVVIDVAKNRHGERGSVPVVLDGPAFRFVPVDDQHEAYDAPPIREAWRDE